MMTIYARSVRKTLTISTLPDRSRRVVLACPCERVAYRVPAGVDTFKAVDELRALHRELAPACPHLEEPR